MAMAVTEAHERRWINTTWELQRQQNPENPEGMRDGEAGAGGDCGSALLSSRVDWELKDWESIPLAYPTSDENCCSSSSLPETVMVSAAVVKSEPQAEVEESEEEEEEEEEEVVHQAPEAAAAAAAAPLKLGLKLGRRSSSSSTEKNKKDKEVSQGSCSTKTPTAVIAPPTAAVAVAVAAGSSSSSPPSTKKQRVTSPSSAAAGGGGGNQNPVPPPRCQVEGCTADLSSAKDYHRRHKVCEMHSKASKAIAAGREQRFCQQCSRFHVLTEFDEIKRSCRRRLAGHNERRRKPHPESSSAAAAAAAAAAAINLSFNCRISSPMRSTDAFHIHGTAADSLTLDDCKQIQQIQGSQGGGRPLSSPDLHDDDEHSNHHHPFANVLNLSSPWRPGENVRSPQHIQVEEKEGQLIMLDRRYCAPSSNRLLMFLQSPRGQMRGALDPSPDVGLSNLSPLVVGGGGGSSQEFVDGAKGSLCQNLSLGGGGGWENNNHHNYHHNQGCESQSSGCALSLLSWGTTPCPPALDLCVDNTSLDHHHHHQLVADNNMGSNTVASFATHHLPQQQTQEHYLAFEKLFSAQSGGLGGMGISDIRITDIQQQQQPLEQSQLHGVGGGGGDDGASGNFLSYLGGLGLDAGNSMLALFQSSHDLQGMRSGVSSAHQSLKVTSDLVRTPSLQVHQQHHLHQVHTTTSVHSQMQTSFNGGGGEYGEFGPPLRACESSLFSTQHML